MARKLSEIETDLETALNRLEKARAEENRARHQTTELLNLVNGYQKEFDQVYLEMKKTAFRETEWGSEKHRKTGIAE